MFRIVRFLSITLASGFALLGQSSTPELPPDVPKDAAVSMVLSDKTPAGQDAVWRTSDGTIHEFFQFNDRGRGPKIYTVYRLDAQGLIASKESKGVDYMKKPVKESFSLVSGTATWTNQSEKEKQANAAGKLYIALNGGAESSAILSRALLHSKNSGKLDVLPGGTAGIHAPEVLRIATFEAANVVSMEKELGSVAPGKYADMILVNGDPTKNIR
ncbi:MAG: amidohydrolase family protein [Bryobacteraceae bacterium]